MATTRNPATSRSLCRDIHDPPPLRRSCCIRIREEIVKDPDPSIYDPQRAFESGAAPAFNSPDIDTVNIWPVAPIPKIKAIVRNLSADASAHNVRVDLSWSQFGIGLIRTPIASSFVNLARAGAAGSEQSVSWPTPPELADAKRFGIFVDVHHPYDRDAANNRGQQTVDGFQTSSGRSRTFTLPVRNPFSAAQAISVAAVPSPQAAWATISPSVLSLAPGGQQNVTVTIKVPPGVPVASPGTLVSASIDIVAHASGQFIGGAAFLILVDS